MSIPRLEDLSIGSRIAITFVAIVAALLILAAVGFLSGRWEAVGQVPPQFYQGLPRDAHLLALDKRALEEAYHQHLIRLWNVWLSDGAKAAGPITTGLRISRQAYHQAAEQIERRERELEQKQ